MSEQQNSGDWLNVFSILLALQNLQENREQTKQNDVQAANDRQAKLLIDEMNTNFSKQNVMIDYIAKRLSIIEKKFDKLTEDKND